MAATKTVITLDRLSQYDGLIKTYIGTEDQKSIKSLVWDSANHQIKFYKVVDPTDAGATPAYTVTIPTTDTSGIEADIDALETLIGSIPTHEDPETHEQVPDADTIVEYIKDLADDAEADAVSASAVTMTASSSQDTPAGMYKTYTFSQNGSSIGTVNVPVDLVVESGEIVVASVEHPITIDGQQVTSGTYLKLVIANQTDPIYIDVADLADVYTAAASASQVQLAISNANEISATLVDGGITKAKLNSALQGSIDAIDDITYATQAEISALFSSGS